MSRAKSARSCASLAKACTTRMPPTFSSSRTLKSPRREKIARQVRVIRPPHTVVTTAIAGTTAAVTRARGTSIHSIRAKAPRNVITAMKRSSGPWWATSPMSSRSRVTRATSRPVRARS